MNGKKKKNTQTLQYKCVVWTFRINLCLFIYHIRPIGFNVLGYQAHGLQQNHFARRRRNLPSLPGTRLMDFHREACSALSQTLDLWLNFTYALLILVSVRGYLVADSGDEIRLF